MSDKMFPLSLLSLFRWIDHELKTKKEIFGIPESLFFEPKKDDPFRLERYGVELETPLGVAAGPQTQLSENIIAAYLTGSRYIELKTIQTLDELEVSKPCIDMADEGYNCEWSQELKLQQSFEEYLNAWIALHAIRAGWGGALPVFEGQGFLFNMSAGYNLEGILNENVQEFLNKMEDCSRFLNEKVEILKGDFPWISDISIPTQISDNITLSTMHGCPPEEIEQIARYLITKRKYHTTVKLNPTLIGSDKLRAILNGACGFDTVVPDEAFEHDLKYEDAVPMLRRLMEDAQKSGVDFAVKLTNTLESKNIRGIFSEKEPMNYMSGRALHPIGVNLALKLQTEFEGRLSISFSGGAGAFNFSDLISCGIWPVTVSSDLLKPGGYTRSLQYLQNLKTVMQKKRAESLSGLAGDYPLDSLLKYAAEVTQNPLYKKNLYENRSTKTKRVLSALDCISAPCSETCPTNQSVPAYMRAVSEGNLEKALAVILKDNPLPGITGTACDHTCTSKCTRQNYDETLQIRQIKRFISENAPGASLSPAPKNGRSLGIIGAGPAGLSAAFYAALFGFEAEVYEAKGFSGGMVADAIPSFRLPQSVIDMDLRRIADLGVKIHYHTKIDQASFSKIRSDHDFTFIAVGAQKAKSMRVAGEDCEGVIDQLKFLSDVRRGKELRLGARAAVVGGGNSAMDAVRTALRLCDEVTLIYRRTKAQMPADREEIEAALEEGVKLMELTQPLRIEKDGDGLKMTCYSMKLGEPDESGRRRPVKVEGSEFELFFDTVIPAIGQDIDLPFVSLEELSSDDLFIGGDCDGGAANIIGAIADGKNVVKKIAGRIGLPLPDEEFSKPNLTYHDYLKKASSRSFGVHPSEIDLSARGSFDMVILPYSDSQAKEEAARCLSCDTFCSLCVTLCPNRANFSYETKPVSYRLAKLVAGGGSAKLIPAGRLFEVKQSVQTANIADFCNECGNCAAFCPTSGAPYRDKPKIALSKEAFDAEKNAFYFTKEDGALKLISKFAGRTEKLWKGPEGWIYDSNEFSAGLRYESFEPFVLSVANEDHLSGEFGFERAALMSILYDALCESRFAVLAE